jgi:hypothetical protein
MSSLFDPVTPNALAAAVLLGWPLICVLGFLYLPKRQAVTALLIGGFLFLPWTGMRSIVPIPLLQNRLETVTAFVLISSLVSDWTAWTRLRFHWADLPIAISCLAPFVASVSNGLGTYDASQATLVCLLGWGAPYALGRAYFGTLKSARELAVAFVVGGLVYAPLCLYEIRMSPQLHRILYGWAQHNFGMTIRFGGYRPMVFLQSGLMVGLWMGVAAVTAFWLWRSGAARTVCRIPMSWAALGLLTVAILCKSVGAIVLMSVAVLLYPVSRGSRAASSALVLLLVLTPAAYCVLRTNGWSAQSFVDMSNELFGADRAQSLDFRVINEDRLVSKALERPLFGWGGWGRSRVYDPEGADVSVTDGLWIIVLGNSGYLGLVSLCAVFAVPVLLLMAIARPRSWAHPALAPAAALALALLMFGIDCLFNAMVNPLYALGAGSLTGCCIALRSASSLPAPGFRTSRSRHQGQHAMAPHRLS